MPDVLKQLPPLIYAGIKIPVTSRSVTFAHDIVEHPLAFKDGRLVEAQGVQNWRFKYTVPMREEITTDNYENLFTKVLPDLVLVMRDRTPQILDDPIYGQFRVEPANFSDDLDVNKRDGTDITIEFIHAPELDDIEILQANLSDIKSAADEARALDDAVELVEWNQEEPPPPITDPLSAIDGLGRQVEAIGNQISAKFDDAAFRLEKLEATIDRLGDPLNWPLKRSSRRLRDTVHRLKVKNEDPLRRVRTVLQAHHAALSEVASNLGMTVQDLLAMNPGLAASPDVEAETRIYYLETA